jgi:signal transduction histidine kinase
LRTFRILLACGAVPLGLIAYRIQIHNIPSPEDRAVATVLVAWSFLGAGLVAWSRRSPSRMGPLMVAAGYALLIRQFRYSPDAGFFTVFYLLGDLSFALIGHVALAYPTGYVRDKYERWLVRIGYFTVIAFPLAVLLVYDSKLPLHEYGRKTRKSLLLLTGNTTVAEDLQKAYAIVFYGVLAALFIALILRKLVRATPRGRRILAPLWLAAIAIALRAVFECVFTFHTRPSLILYNELFWWQIGAAVCMPIALLAGLLRARLARAGVGDLLLELERTPPYGLRGVLARALGDPTLQVAYWLPERNEYVDAAGTPVQLPEDGPLRAVTRLENDGRPVAALVHDPSLREEPKLIDAVAAAARLSLENARLQAETRAQLVQVRESRARIVAAADEERRRIERDIHDGAQQRLVALGLQLRNAQRRLGRETDPEVEQLLSDAVGELQLAVYELRELARGVHPAVLTEEGLAAALESLVGRTPFPITLDVAEERLPEQVEATAYFVACEALTNMAKHAHASRATICAHRQDGVVKVEIEDDGIGGAFAKDGSGLRGLADRVEALGGRLTIESPPSGGTRIVAEMPCAS